MKEKNNIPGEKEFKERVGKKVKLWKEVVEYISENYDHEPVLSVGKKEFDWTIRYRKSGKTLVTLTPEKDDFCVLIVLGAKEVAKAEEVKLNPYVNEIFRNAKQYHDGRWLFIRPKSSRDLESIKMLLGIKRKPKK